MTISTIKMDKAALRKQAFAARKLANTPLAVRAANDALIAYLAKYTTPQIFAGYMPIRTEVDPLPTMTALCAAGHTLTVPVIVGPDQPLRFCQWHPDVVMIDGPFGAKIPKESNVLIPDVVIAPLVGFDARGHRLGYGGGYYDRSLAQISAIKSVHVIGFAFSGQELPEIPAEKTDYPLAGIVTENGLVNNPSAN